MNTVLQVMAMYLQIVDYGGLAEREDDRECGEEGRAQRRAFLSLVGSDCGFHLWRLCFRLCLVPILQEDDAVSCCVSRGQMVKIEVAMMERTRRSTRKYLLLD